VDAVRAGAGIGFLPINGDRENKKLVMMKSSLAEWDSALWLVTHRDLNRVAKVNALTQFLVERMRTTFS
jgi:DNA-binding transcriptional LysR family regulator